jgi:hypothetical protein
VCVLIYDTFCNIIWEMHLSFSKEYFNNIVVHCQAFLFINYIPPDGGKCGRNKKLLVYSSVNCCVGGYYTILLTGNRMRKLTTIREGRRLL